MCFFLLVVSPNGSVAVSPNISISNLGDNVTFTCSAQGGPNNTFQWMKDGEILDNETEGVLVLTDITASDGGVYTCVVSNAAGNDSDICTLYVSPYFITEPVDEILTSFGESVNFMCEAEGFPTPSISWLNVDTETQVANGSILMFGSVAYSDAGRYQCVASSMISNGSDLTDSVEPPSTLFGEFNSIIVHDYTPSQSLTI